MPKKSTAESDAPTSVVVFGNLHDGWRFAPLDATGGQGEASEPYADRPDCLSAAWTAHPDIAVRLAE